MRRMSVTSGWRYRLAGGVAGNRRLTAATGVVLHTLLWIQIASAVLFALMAWNIVLPPGPLHALVRPVHFFVGFMLMPLVAIKLGSTGYRFLRYYTRNERYKIAGPPTRLERALAPVLVASILVVFVSGVEMWGFFNQFGIAWIPVHVIAAITFLVALTMHIVFHVREAHDEAAAEVAGIVPDDTGVAEGDWNAGRVTRRVVIGAGLLGGVALAVSTSQFPSAALSWLSPRRAGSGALDFPVMNFEGGPQQVDLARYELVVDGDPGLVSNPLRLRYSDILAMPTEQHVYSIDCVTGWTATRSWKGVSLSHILAKAGTDPSFGNVLVRSTSGYHWSHDRAHALLAGTLLVTHIDGVVLNDDHGFPVRLMVPGVQGQANIKWVDGIHVGAGAPERYFAPSLTYNPSLPTTGKLLPADPAGHRP